MAVSSENHVVSGFIEYSDGSWVPNKVSVTITNNNTGQSTVKNTTTSGSGHTGAYITDVYDLGAEIGHIIFINISYGGCTGGSEVVVTDAPGQVCNITICCNLPPLKPNQATGNTSIYRDINHTYSTSTTDEDGDDVYYWFDWGDQTNTGWIGPYTSGETINITHSWSAPGNYNVKIKAKDTYGAERGAGWSDTLPVTVINRPPTKTSKPTGETEIYTNVTYSYSTKATDPDGDSIYYWFDWGEGNNSGWVGTYNSGVKGTTSYTWTKNGTYQIKTKVKDIFNTENTEGWSDPLNITVTTPPNFPPLAEFTYSPTNPKKDTMINFTDYSFDTDGYIASWSWDFDDGTNSTEQNPSHIYNKTGSYEVTLTVTDNENATDNMTLTITVTSKSTKPDKPWDETIEINLKYNKKNKGINYTVWRGEPINASELIEKIQLAPGEYIELFNRTSGGWQRYIADGSKYQNDFIIQPWDILIIKCKTDKKIQIDISKQNQKPQSIKISYSYNTETKKGNNGYNYFAWTSSQITSIDEFVELYKFSDKNIEISVYNTNNGIWDTYNPSLPTDFKYSFYINPYDIICIKLSEKSAESVLTIN
jgi:PKD repeat protein